MVLRFLLLSSVIAVAVGSAIDLKAWAKSLNINSKSTIPEIGLNFLKNVRTFAEAYIRDHPEAKASEYPYFNFIPMWRASLVPDKNQFGPVTWEGTCFAQNSATTTTQSDGSIKISITTGVAASQGCYDHYILITATGIDRLRVSGDTVATFTLPADITDAEKWDLANKGIRLMQILTDEPTTIANLLETVLLFVPEFTQGVDKRSAERNVDFLNRYTPNPMAPRDPKSSTAPPAEKVHSGDFFGVIRLDGLDPMLAWAMGSTTGHTTVALWIDGELYICESTAVSSYWPVNGIQKTPYKEWLKLAEQAGYNVVHAPLNEAVRAHFDEAAAVNFFRSVEGVDYGYQNMFWGWIDTLYDNYPCVPSDFSSVCLSFEVLEPLFATIDRHIPQISEQMWNQAFNKRIGTQGLRTAEIYQTASVSNGINARTIPMMPELDGWLYNTTRYDQPVQGPQLVCCVFVCNVWKAAGVFDGMDVNCAEQTNLDDYSLTLFEEKYTQIMGKYTLALNRYNSKIPFSHMAEACPSKGPDYIQDPTC